MLPNHSPWIAQLNRRHEVHHLSSNRKTQVAIIGAGIAGISTAYYTLRNTKLSVFLVEADKVAHGATGHNAGQIVSYFERQLSSLVEEYGLKMAAKAQNSIDSAWVLLEKIYREAKIQTPFTQFTGYAGCQDLDEVIVHLENNIYAKLAHINTEPLMVAIDSDIAGKIPEKYKGLYSLLPQKDILSLLETEDKSYVAALSARKGVLNSALFCEDLLDYLFKTYPDRFTLFEESPVGEVVLTENLARLKVHSHEVTAEKVVLCTNGFERFTITNLAGEDVDTKFHHLVKGSVGYMAAYLEDHSRSPVAISYLPNQSNTGNEAFDTDPYFYLTRRTFELEGHQNQSLICIGGPESLMDDTNNYSQEHPYPNEAQDVIDKFLHKTYMFAPKGEIKYQYRWHGLMGYTPNGVRCVGPEPINPVLLYNLGCNGVGILPSIYGGKKISHHLNDDALEKTIFDPKDSRKR